MTDSNKAQFIEASELPAFDSPLKLGDKLTYNGTEYILQEIERDREGDITLWIYHSQANQKLIIFND